MPNSFSVSPPILPQSWASAWGEDEFGIWMEFEYKGVVQRFRWIQPGRFLMGSPQDEAERLDNELQHEVELTRGFWLADTACTQALWEAVMGENPSNFKGAERPVEEVSWNECQVFIGRINKAVPDLNLRLPTEAQWEYACRAGTITPFSFGENITPEQVNYNGNYPYKKGPKGEFRSQTVEVGTLPPNDWGLYEMHGNVWEWCSDWYGPYAEERSVDPQGPAEGGSRVVRGGSWIDRARNCRSACRGRDATGLRDLNVGFRLSPGQEGQEKGRRAEPRAAEWNGAGPDLPGG